MVNRSNNHCTPKKPAKSVGSIEISTTNGFADPGRSADGEAAVDWDETIPIVARLSAEERATIWRLRRAYDTTNYWGRRNVRIEKRASIASLRAQGIEPVKRRCRKSTPRRVRQCHNQILARFRDASGVRRALLGRIPAKPYCSDDLRYGVRILSKSAAIDHKYLQLNGPCMVVFLVFDCDEVAAREAAENAGLPQPNFVVRNADNDKGHIVYKLRVPVSKTAASRRKPIEWLAAVQRGTTKVLGADPWYTGLITKNPFCDHWRVEWITDHEYSLEELDCCLTPLDKRKTAKRIDFEQGVGRNVSLFDHVRKRAYKVVQRFYGTDGSVDDGEGRLYRRLVEIAEATNARFHEQLHPREVGATVQSIYRFVLKFRRQSAEDFSNRQRHRANLRWKDHDAASTSKPWNALGISRSTYYRRKAAGEVPAAPS